MGWWGNLVATFAQDKPEKDPLTELLVLDQESSVGNCMSEEFKEMRWLPNCEIGDIFTEYQHYWSSNVPKAAETLFRAEFKQHWLNKCIKIRKKNQHKQCRDCAELDAAYKKAHSDVDKKHIHGVKSDHIAGVFADRRAKTRLVSIAAMTINSPSKEYDPAAAVLLV